MTRGYSDRVGRQGGGGEVKGAVGGRGGGGAYGCLGRQVWGVCVWGWGDAVGMEGGAFPALADHRHYLLTLWRGDLAPEAGGRITRHQVCVSAGLKVRSLCTATLLPLILFVRRRLHRETDERSCPPQIAYGPVQLALRRCCLWPEVPPQPLMVQAVR